MNGLELQRMITPMSVEQMRAMCKSAAAVLGMTPRQVVAMRDIDTVGGPASITHQIVWLAYFEKRVFAKTGKKILQKATTSGGSNRWVAEETCDWAAADKFVAELFAA